MLLQEFPHLKKQYWGRHLWARGYFAVTSGTITDEVLKKIAVLEAGKKHWARAKDPEKLFTAA